MVRGSYLLLLGLTAWIHVQAETAHARRTERPLPQFGNSLLRLPQGLLFNHLAAGGAAPDVPETNDRATAADNDANSDSPDGQDAAAKRNAQGTATTAGHSTDESSDEPTAQVVHTDYKKAMTEASQSRKMLFVYFHDPGMTAARQAFEQRTLAQLEIREKLKRYVLLELPTDAQITVDGKPLVLLSHPAFAEMLGRPGVAVIDLAHERADYYGHVVSTFPFSPGKYYRQEAISVILDLPPGSLTQRTMIYAVRIHPEGPASTQGRFHTVLAEEAQSHAVYQASIQVQGHHSWDMRFHRISSKLSNGVLPTEVVAESWPNENLVEACVECVHSWRQSPGHWGAVRRRHALFGYDIKRGRNGIWYATGIFGGRLR